MNLPEQKRIFDPVNNKFTSLETKRGILIKEYNDFCEKCSVEEIYDYTSEKCKKINDKRVKNKLKDEIEYCKKYNKAMKRAISDDSRILANILNIKIPSKFFNKSNSNSNLKIRDFISDSLSSKNSFLAKRLNIKNLAYAEYINFVPVLIYALYQLFSLNPELKIILLKAVSRALSSTKGGLVSIYIKVFTDYIKSDFLTSFVSNFSFTKFVAFVTSVLAVFSNLPASSRENSQKMTRVSEVIATGRNVAFDIYNIETENRDTRKTLHPTSNELFLINNFIKGAYRESDKSISLTKLGLNNNIVNDPRTILAFGYNDIEMLPFVEIITSNYRKSVYIIHEKIRESKIKDLEEKTTSIINVLEKKQNSIIQLRDDIKKATELKKLTEEKETLGIQKETYKKHTLDYDKISKRIKDAYKKSENLKKERDFTDISQEKKKQISSKLKKLTEEIETLEIQKETYKKYTQDYNKISKKIKDVYKKSKKLKKEIGDFTDIPQEEKIQISSKIKNITETRESLLSLRKEMKKLNTSNFNFYYNDMEKKIDSSMTFIKTVDDPQIAINNLPVISKNTVDMSQPFFIKKTNNSYPKDIYNIVPRNDDDEFDKHFKKLEKKKSKSPIKEIIDIEKNQGEPRKSPESSRRIIDIEKNQGEPRKSPESSRRIIEIEKNQGESRKSPETTRRIIEIENSQGETNNISLKKSSDGKKKSSEEFKISPNSKKYITQMNQSQKISFKKPSLKKESSNKPKSMFQKLKVLKVTPPTSDDEEDEEEDEKEVEELINMMKKSPKKNSKNVSDKSSKWTDFLTSVLF